MKSISSLPQGIFTVHTFNSFVECYVVLLKPSTKLKGAQAQYLATALVLLLIQSSRIFIQTR
jgi:hypothetical protein